MTLPPLKEQARELLANDSELSDEDIAALRQMNESGELEYITEGEQLVGFLIREDDDE